MRWGWRWVWCLLCVAQGAAQTTIRARPLLHEDALAYRGAYVVDIERRGGDVRGTLIVRDALETQYLYELDLPANARKRLYLNVATQPPLGSLRRAHAPRLEWQSAAGERVLIDAPSPLPMQLPIVVVGDLIGGLETLNQKQGRAISVLAPTEQNMQLPLKVYYWRVSDLPDDWRALLEVPILVLTEGSETLTDAQQRALHIWLNAGGTLVIDKSAFTNWRATPFAALIAPAQPETPYLELEQGLLYRRVGQGVLYLVEGDRRAERIRKRLEPALLRIVQGVMLLSEQLTRYSEGWKEHATPPLQLARLEYGIAVLIVYGSAVWLLSAWLRRRRRLASVFKPLLGLTVIACTAVVLLAPRPPQTTPVVVHSVFQSDAAPTLEYSVLFATLRAGKHRLTLPDESLLLDAQTQPFAPLRVRYSTAPPEAELHCRVRTTVMLSFARPTPSAAYLSVQRIGEQLILRNVGRETLQVVALQLRRMPSTPVETVWRTERMMPNQTVSVPLPPSARTGRLWVLATLPRRAPAIALEGQPVQEVSYLFVGVQ